MTDESRWDVVRGGVLACRGCARRMGEGEQYRRLTQFNRPYCPDCTKRVLGEDAPASMPVVPLMTSLADHATARRDAARVTRAVTDADVRCVLEDCKLRQLPERDR